MKYVANLMPLYYYLKNSDTDTNISQLDGESFQKTQFST